jgi:hypothetical protein
MPIYIDTDNNNVKDKLYNGSKAGSAAVKVEAKMQAVVKKAVEKAGFTTTKVPNAKGYSVRLEISNLELGGHDTKCELKGSIVRYPKGVTMSRGAGDEMLSLGWGGKATASGTGEGAIIDCVEAIAEDMMKKGVPVMNSDFMKR